MIKTCQANPAILHITLDTKEEYERYAAPLLRALTPEDHRACSIGPRFRQLAAAAELTEEEVLDGCLWEDHDIYWDGDAITAMRYPDGRLALRVGDEHLYVFAPSEAAR